jgi:hypothetical protein
MSLDPAARLPQTVTTEMIATAGHLVCAAQGTSPSPRLRRGFASLFPPIPSVAER